LIDPMTTPRWFTHMILRTFRLRFLFARFTRLPLMGAFFKRTLFGGDAIVYLPQNRAVEVSRTISPGSQMFIPSEVIERFVDRSSHIVLMNWCICRKASGCKDYPQEFGCLFLGEASKHIDPELGRPVTKEEAIAHLKKCREAGLVHMIGHNRVDSIWLNARPHRKLLTVCNCCPCCCLWKILPGLSPVISTDVTKMPGLEMTVDIDKCTGCGACTKSCFVNAITVDGGKARISPDCRGCGRCAVKCPRSAIEVKMGDIEGTVERIASAVDVS